MKIKKDSIKIPESPDDAQKRFKGLISGSRGDSFVKIFPDEKKINFFKKIKKISDQKTKKKGKKK